MVRYINRRAGCRLFDTQSLVTQSRYLRHKFCAAMKLVICSRGTYGELRIELMVWTYVGGHAGTPPATECHCIVAFQRINLPMRIAQYYHTAWGVTIW
jgi:hypothetical protein